MSEDKPGLFQILGRARQMQERLARIQQELATRTVEGSAGGGMVTAEVGGDLRVRRIRIDPALLGSGDVAMISDLVTAAVNAGIANAQRMMQEEMQRAAGLSLGDLVPGGGEGPGT